MSTTKRKPSLIVRFLDRFSAMQIAGMVIAVLLAIGIGLTMLSDVLEAPYRLDSGQGLVMIPETRQALDEYLDALARNDGEKQAYLLRTGWGVLASDGDGIVVIKQGPQIAYVRHSKSDRLGFVPVSWLKKSRLSP